jgi:hypothetical protein
VKLDLETDIESIGQDPFSKVTGAQRTLNGRKGHLGLRWNPITSPKKVPAPFVVFPVAAYDLDFIPGTQVVYPLPIDEFGGDAAPGRFEIDDPVHTGGNHFQRNEFIMSESAAGFQQDRAPVVHESGQEFHDPSLQKRFSSGHQDRTETMATDLSED